MPLPHDGAFKCIKPLPGIVPKRLHHGVAAVLVLRHAQGAIDQRRKKVADTARFTADPCTYSSEAFDAASILMDGIEAGNTTRPKLLSFVEGLPPYNGISKKIEFKANGNLAATTVYFFEVKNGKFAPLTNTDKI